MLLKKWILFLRVWWFKRKKTPAPKAQPGRLLSYSLDIDNELLKPYRRRTGTNITLSVYLVTIDDLCIALYKVNTAISNNVILDERINLTPEIYQTLTLDQYLVTNHNESISALKGKQAIQSLLERYVDALTNPELTDSQREYYIRKSTHLLHDTQTCLEALRTAAIKANER